MQESDSAIIQQIASSVEGETTIEIVKEIYGYIMRNLTYDPSYYERLWKIRKKQTRRMNKAFKPKHEGVRIWQYTFLTKEEFLREHYGRRHW